MKRHILTPLLLFAALCTQAQQYTQIIQQWKDSVRQATDKIIQEKIIRQDQDSMPLFWTIYGQEPADGRSLWISLHGGGGTTQEVNNQQWRNQMYLYKPAEGVYVAPRSPWNAWDMWCQAPIDSMYRTLIRTMVTHYNVNPDKVYILGYSAGGDGVWRMAPRMADHWAATSMMAGHPGYVRLENLYNTPFMIWMGENDDAYERNRLAVVRTEQMDSLKRIYPDGYPFESHIIKGKGHWMDRQDSAAIAWMAKFERRPWPRKVIWQQEEVFEPYFYWLGAPKNELRWGKRIDAEVKGNTISITRCDYSRITLFLSDELVDFGKKVTVKILGKTVFKDKVNPSTETFRNTLYLRQDPRMAAPVVLNLDVPRSL